MPIFVSDTLSMHPHTHEIRALLKLTAPILATQLAQIGMGTVDTIMSGHVSTLDLAAVAIGTSIWLPIWLFLAGILVALSPITARLSAAAQTEKLPYLLAAALWMGIVFGLIAAIMLGSSRYLLPLLIDDATTAQIAGDYLTMIAFGMPSAGVFLAYRFYAEALNQAGHVTRIMLIGLILNVPINWIFIEGLFGMPALGGVGCGVGSSLVFTGMAIAMALNTRRHRLMDAFSLWPSVWSPQWLRVQELVKIGLPIGLAIFFEVSLFSVIALFLTVLGPTIVAGHQVALNVSSLTFMVPLSLGMALTVRVGHHLGRQEVTFARRLSWLGVNINLALAVLNATLIVLLARWIAAVYSPDPEVVAIASALLIFAAVFQLSDAVQIAAAGALRAYQDTLAVMLITFISYWVLGLGLGYYLAFKLPEPMGAAGFWIGLIVGLTSAAIALSWRLRHVSRHPPSFITQTQEQP